MCVCEGGGEGTGEQGVPKGGKGGAGGEGGIPPDCREEGGSKSEEGDNPGISRKGVVP